MLVWFRAQRHGEGQPALVLTVRVRMSDVEQAIQGMVLPYMTQRPGADKEGVPGSTSTRREPVNSLQHEPLSIASLFFYSSLPFQPFQPGPPPSLRGDSH